MTKRNFPNLKKSLLMLAGSKPQPEHDSEHNDSERHFSEPHFGEHSHTAGTPMDLNLRQRIAQLLSGIRPELPEQVTVHVLNHEVYVSGSVNLASEAMEIIHQIQALPAVREVHHLLTVRCRCRICSPFRR